jgi:hypothetical protein
MFRRSDHPTPFYVQKLALTSLTSGGRSVGIVRWRTEATEFIIVANTALYIFSCLLSQGSIRDIKAEMSGLKGRNLRNGCSPLRRNE